MPISLYSGYQQLVGSNGHYNSYNFGYNVYGEVHDRIDTLYYVFSTNGAAISQYTFSIIFFALLCDLTYATISHNEWQIRSLRIIIYYR